MAQTSAAADGSGGSSSEPLLSWVLTIEGAINKEMKYFPGTGAAMDRPQGKFAIFRIPKLVMARLDAKDKTYTPAVFSLGLFHRPGRLYVPPNRGESFKVRMACAFLATIFRKEDRLQKSLTQLKSKPDFEQQVMGLEAKFKSNLKTADIDQTVSVAVVRLGLRDHVWKELCTEVVGGAQGLEDIKRRYQLEDEDQVTEDESDEVIKCSITLDAIALATGMCILYLHEKKELFSFDLFRVDGCRSDVLEVHFDALKLENQVPLSLLRKVLQILYKEPIKADDTLNEVCVELAIDFSIRYLPGYEDTHTRPHIDRLKENRTFLDCDHLLGCISRVLRVDSKLPDEKQKNFKCGKVSGGKLLGRVAQYVRDFCSRRCSTCSNDENIGASPSKPRNFNIPSATRLHERGIVFRQLQCGDRLDLLPVFKPHWLTATLYIPRLPRLSMLTLTAWKNLVAYECRAVHNRKMESQFLAIIAFMDCLIDTKEDVLLMTRGRKPVLPDRYGSSPEDLARVFNTILTGFPVPEYPRWIALKQEITNYHQRKWRRLLGLEFLRDHFGKPWLFVSLLAASVLLILTFLQTVYAMLAFYDSRT